MGDAVVRLGGVPEVWVTSESFERDAGDTERGPASTCIRSSAVDALLDDGGGSVAIGGRLIVPVLFVCEAKPAPIGRG